MGIFSWVILGLIAGVVAKLLVPGRDPGGIIVTMLIGIVGALIGGYIGTYLGWSGPAKIDLRNVVLAVGGAVILLILYRLLT